MHARQAGRVQLNTTAADPPQVHVFADPSRIAQVRVSKHTHVDGATGCSVDAARRLEAAVVFAIRTSRALLALRGRSSGATGVALPSRAIAATGRAGRVETCEKRYGMSIPPNDCRDCASAAHLAC